MHRFLAIAIGACALACGSVAAAQETPRAPEAGRRIAAPRGALELGIAAGYAQGVGSITSRPLDRLQDIAGAGAAGEVDVGVRPVPAFAIGLYGTGSAYQPNQRLGEGSGVRSASAGIQADVHFRPFRSVDPWIGLGTGVRGHWISPERGGVTSRYGLELVRVQLGVDYRVSPEVAMGPRIGASADLFLREQAPGTSLDRLDGERVNAFVFAGLAARFDVLGSAESESTGVAHR
jgi:hypothetical protein